MTEKLGLYKCSICGNLVQVILSGGGELVCCGKPMTYLKPKNNSDEILGEKHVPRYMTDKDKEYIQVGSILHPMTNEHYIQFVEAFSQDKNRVTLQYFSPEEKPIMNLDTSLGQDCNSLAYCNLHGLWEGEHD